MKKIIQGLWLLALVIGGVASASTEWNTQEYDLYAGDFDGNGYADILYIAKDPSMPSGIALSNGSGVAQVSWQSWESNFLGIDWSSNHYNVIIGDFNGDGKSDIFLQSASAGGNSFLLLTSSAGLITGISQTIGTTNLGLTWTADQHKIIAGAFSSSGTVPKFGLFLQATDSAGIDAIVQTTTAGVFPTTGSPSQTWQDGFSGLNWSTKSANVFAGNFNGNPYGLASLLAQAKPKFVTISYDVPFPVPTYKPNLNGVVIATSAAGGTSGTYVSSFAASGAQLWSRKSNGVDWSPLTNTIVIVNTTPLGKSTVVLQGRYSGRASFELIGNASGTIFPAAATTLTSNVSLTSDSYRLIAGNFGNNSTGGLYYEAATSGGTNYVTLSVGTTGAITASSQNPGVVTGTVEPTSAGRTAGQFSITPTGAATYNIPIWTPPGARGVEPHLSISYTSGGPDGVMGPGWTLTGISSIARCGKTWASTGGSATALGAPVGVTLSTTDDLCLDGKRLRLLSGSPGMGGATYMTEVADFSRITANGSSSGPATSFTVEGKDGQYYEYGNAITSPYSQVISSGTTIPYVWGIDKVYDRQSNSVLYSYTLGATTLTLSTIQYTNSPTRPGYYPYSVSFSYGSSRAGGTVLTKFVAGGTVTQAKELNSIVVTSAVNSVNVASTTIVRQYNLSYSASPTTNRPLLQSVQECGGPSGGDCLRPTTITYQTGAAGWSTTPVSTGLSGQYGFIPIDLNGDGIPDAVYSKLSGTNIQWYARIATLSGYGSEILITGAITPTSGLTPTILPGAFSGKASIQFLAAVNNIWTLFSYSGGAFTSTPTNVAVNNEVTAVDYDGDGLPDLVSYSGYSALVRKNVTVPGGNVTFAPSPTTVFTSIYPLQNIQYPLTPIDINGDGKADLAFLVTICGKVKCNYSVNIIISNGFSQPASGLSQNLSGYSSMSFGDWNGDGCTDIIEPAFVLVSNCAGGFTQYATQGPAGTGVGITVDWDGDGQTDFIYADSTTNKLMALKSTGTGSSLPISLGITLTSTQSLFAFDRNSDGQQDIGIIDSSSNTISYLPHNGVNADGTPQPPDLASGITDGFGINFSPTYAPISQSSIYTPGTTPAMFPDIDLKVPFYVVSQFSASDGTGGTYQTSFTYSGAHLNLQGRSFEGFATTTSVDNRLGYNLIHSTAYSQTFPTIGAVLEDDVFQPTSPKKPISTTSNSYSVVQLTSSSVGYTGSVSVGAAALCPVSCFPYMTQTVKKQYEYGGTANTNWISQTTTAYIFDAYGTLTDTKSMVIDEDAGSTFNQGVWVTEIQNSITNYPTSWCLGRPYATKSLKTAAGEPTVPRTVNHTVDSTNCRATNETVEPSTPSQVVTTFGFDLCGNTNSTSVVGQDENNVAMPARVTTMNYVSAVDSRCQSPESVTKLVAAGPPAFSQTSHTAYRYDLGVKQSTTDANGVPVKWVYDDFGRKSTEIRPDLTSTTWAYVDCVAPSCWGTSDIRLQTTETLLNSAGSPVRVHQQFTDAMDRVRYDEGNRALGVWDTQVTQYDKWGRKSTIYLPYSSSSNGYHQITYDALSRPVTDTLFNSSGTSYRAIQIAYAGQTTTLTDPKANKTVRVTDVSGKLRSVMDPPEGVHGAAAGTTKYTYDSWGNLIEIDDANIPSNKSYYYYNTRGFKIKSIDADSGTWIFTPDSLNELKTQLDANGNTTKFTYDLLGRMITRLEPESTTPTQWNYGTSASLHEIGQLNSVTKPDGYAENYVYDSLGRPQTKIYTEDGTPYQFDYAYNAIGTQDTLTYPTSTSGVRFQLKFGYDSTGYLKSVSDASAGIAFWTLTSANDASLPTMEVLGNAVSVTTGYTPWTNEMISRSEGTAGSTTNLQNLTYAWDVNGNMKQRQDNIQGLTEVFTLDNLNRLSTVTLNGSQTLSVQYDQAGDIIYKSDIGNYTYGNTSHPHAVTAATGWAIGYDANGNMNSRAGGSISSYSYNLPNLINFSGSSTQFNYDSSHQRWKQIANYGGTAETTHYIGGLLQVVTRGSNPTEYRHQIPAGSSSAIYTRRTDGTASTYYSTSDHLGSADLVMDNSQNVNVLVRESFTPFGQRRGSNWAAPSSTVPSAADWAAFTTTTRQGFTGHEMLDSVSLIHMNGRVYDPTLGRFLSADSVISNLGMTQSVNPYSYASNDPLRYVDPSGHNSSSWNDLGNFIFDVVDYVVAAVLAYYTFIGLGGGFWGAVGGGFVGGFTGALLATGNLSAALSAGLMGAAIGAIGAYGGQLASGIAQVAIGCARGSHSSGNCGRLAEAELFSLALSPQPQSGGGSTGEWGKAIEAGAVSAIASKIAGGSLESGFSYAAGSYLGTTFAGSIINGQSAGANQTPRSYIGVCDSQGSICSEGDPGFRLELYGSRQANNIDSGYQANLNMSPQQDLMGPSVRQTLYFGAGIPALAVAGGAAGAYAIAAAARQARPIFMSLGIISGTLETIDAAGLIEEATGFGETFLQSGIKSFSEFSRMGGAQDAIVEAAEAGSQSAAGAEAAGSYVPAALH